MVDGNHPRAGPKDAIDRVYTFISNIPTQESLYSRSDNKHRKYISADLCIAELHRQFLIANPDLDQMVKYEKFRDIFNHDFNISFGHPRKDICNVCEKFKVDIRSTLKIVPDLAKNPYNKPNDRNYMTQPYQSAKHCGTCVLCCISRNGSVTSVM